MPKLVLTTNYAQKLSFEEIEMWRFWGIVAQAEAAPVAVAARKAATQQMEAGLKMDSKVGSMANFSKKQLNDINDMGLNSPRSKVVAKLPVPGNSCESL